MPLPLTFKRLEHFKPFLSCDLLIIFHVPAGTQERTVPAKARHVPLYEILLAGQGAYVAGGHFLNARRRSGFAAVLIVTVDTIAILGFDGCSFYGNVYPDIGILCPFESDSSIQDRFSPHMGDILPCSHLKGRSGCGSYFSRYST